MFEPGSYENQDFSHTCLPQMLLEKARFAACSFACADFSELTEIRNCTFDGCDFSSAALKGVTIRGSAFLNCRFPYANLFAATFSGCKMTGSSFFGTNLPAAIIDGGDWSYVDLRQLAFDKKELRNVKFANADLRESKLTRCKLIDCDFTKAYTTKLDLRDSDLCGCRIDGIDVLSMNWKNTKVDFEQCIVIAEAMGAKCRL